MTSASDAFKEKCGLVFKPPVIAGGTSWNAGNAHHRGSYNPNAITIVFKLND
jgi:hypothetical protein